jgi:hypothetical protein
MFDQECSMQALDLSQNTWVTRALRYCITGRLQYYLNNSPIQIQIGSTLSDFFLDFHEGIPRY